MFKILPSNLDAGIERRNMADTWNRRDSQPPPNPAKTILLPALQIGGLSGRYCLQRNVLLDSSQYPILLSVLSHDCLEIVPWDFVRS